MPISHMLLAMAMAVVTTGYTSLVSHPVTLMAPSIFTFALLFISSSDPRAKLRPIWFILPTVMILITLMSANQSTGKFTSLIHSIGMFIPFYALLYSSASLRKIIFAYAVFSSVLLLCWIGAMALQVEQFKAWAIEGMGGSGNLLAAQLNMLIPFLYQTSKKNSGFMRIFSIVLIGIASIFIVLLMSRNGIASLACTLILLSMFNHRKAALITCTCVWGVMQIQPDLVHIDTVLDTLRKFRFVEYESRFSRTIIWGIAGDAIRENPILGVGPGNSDDALSMLNMNHAHNNVIQVALEMGVFCAGLVLIVSIYATFITVKLFLGDQTKLIAGLPVFSYLIYSVTASPIQHPEITLLLVLTMNHALTVVDETNSENARPHRKRSRKHGFIVPQRNPAPGFSMMQPPTHR